MDGVWLHEEFLFQWHRLPLFSWCDNSILSLLTTCMVILSSVFIWINITFLAYQWHMLLHWRYNGRDGVSKHQRLDCLLNHLWVEIEENIKAPRHWPVTSRFPSLKTNNAENVSIWWRHHALHQVRRQCILLSKLGVHGKCFHLMTSSWGLRMRRWCRFPSLICFSEVRLEITVGCSCCQMRWQSHSRTVRSLLNVTNN